MKVIREVALDIPIISDNRNTQRTIRKNNNMENNDDRKYMPLMGGMTWTEGGKKLTIFMQASEEEGTYCPAQSIVLYKENAKRVYDLLHKTFGAQSTEEIEVEVRGGVAYCDDERVKIIDHDNQEEPEPEREPIKVTWSNSLDILKQVQQAKWEAQNGSPTECADLLEFVETMIQKEKEMEVKP